MIFMNGKPTALENIFEVVHDGRPDLWYLVSNSDVGRPITDILKEWVDRGSTHYYLNGKLTTFERR